MRHTISILYGYSLTTEESEDISKEVNDIAERHYPDVSGVTHFSREGESILAFRDRVMSEVQ